MEIVVPEDLAKVLAAAMAQDRSAALKKEMLERLALAYINTPETWHGCKEVLRSFKMVRDVEPHVKILARELAEIPSIGAPPSAEKSVSDVWIGAPVGDNVWSPSGYRINDSSPAIERIEHRTIGDTPYEKRVPVCYDPLVISRRIGHIQSRSILLEVQFRTNQGWRKMIQERDVLFSSRKIVDTARLGMPVSSGNALDVTEYLRSYETCNREQIPMGYATSAMGWQGDDENPTKHGFLCGTRQIGGNGRAIELDGSDGDMAIARELRPKGTLEGWIDGIGKMIGFTGVKIALCASLAAPLLAVLDAPNTILEWSGRTSTGKSTLLQLGQSAWRSAKTKMSTWNTTTIGLEASAQFMCDLPLMLDDTSAAGDGGRSQNLSKAIYQLISGRARGRANKDGNQRVRSKWRTVVLSTGEATLGELAKAEGAAARVLTFWSAPLGETSEETKALVAVTTAQLSENYGFAGPMVVKWLAENRERWDDLRKEYAECTRRVSQMIASPAAARLSDTIALLECAAWVAHQAGCMPWIKGPLSSDPAVLAYFKSALSMASSHADRAYEAWEHMMSEAQSKPKSWIHWGEEPSDDRDPPGGWLGYKRIKEVEMYAWFPHHLRKLLTGGGFQVEATLRAWKDLEILVKPEKSRYTSQVRPGSTRSKQRLICVACEYPGHEMPDD